MLLIDFSQRDRFPNLRLYIGRVTKLYMRWFGLTIGPQAGPDIGTGCYFWFGLQRNPDWKERIFWVPGDTPFQPLYFLNWYFLVRPLESYPKLHL